MIEAKAMFAMLFADMGGINIDAAIDSVKLKLSDVAACVACVMANTTQPLMPRHTVWWYNNTRGRYWFTDIVLILILLATRTV